MNIINVRFKISVGFRKTLLFVITDSAQVEDKAVDSLYNCDLGCNTNL